MILFSNSKNMNDRKKAVKQKLFRLIRFIKWRKIYNTGRK